MSFKNIGKLFCIVVLFACIFTANLNVEALKVKTTGDKNMYDPTAGTIIRNFHVLVDVDNSNNKYYCLEESLKLPNGEIEYGNETEINYGFVNVIKNGTNKAFSTFDYSSVSNPTITEDDAYYFRTQMAVWLYNNQTIYQHTGYENVNINDKLKAYSWISGVLNSSNSSSATIPTIKVSLSGATTLNLSDDQNYFESELITVTSTQTSPITLKIEAITSVDTSQIKIVNSSGKEVSSVSNGEKVRIKVPVKLIDLGKEFGIKLIASSSISGSVDAAYKYTPSDGSYQSIVTIKKKNYNESDSAELSFTTKRSNSVTVSKRSVTGTEELPGATLQIEDENGNIVKYCTSPSGENNSECKWISTNKPYEIKNLPEGTYYLVETIAPDGYVLSKKRVKFEMKLNTVARTVSMLNEYTKVEITKINDIDERILPGAKLQVLDSKGNKMSCKVLNKNGKIEELEDCTWISGEDPITIVGLKKGTYYLTELTAPDGYILNNEKIPFEVDGKTEVISVKMVNSLEVEVPDTLGTGSSLLLCFAMFDIALGIGILTYVKKNKLTQ